MLTDIVFYIYIPMVLLVAIESQEILDWLWWYPPQAAHGEDLSIALFRRSLPSMMYNDPASRTSI
jgi:hypothetical protein